MSNKAQFRTCPETGLKVDLAAEKLIKVNIILSVVFLAVGGLFGLLVALTRWPAVHLLSDSMFYLALTAHGADVLIFWIIFFEMAMLYFCSAILLNSRLAAPKMAWAAFWLQVVGAVMANVAVLQGNSSVMFTSYVPMQAAPHFYLGLILFAVGILVGVFVFFATLVIAKEEKTYEGSVPLVTFGAITAAIIAVFTVACGAIILVPTFLWSLDLIPTVDPLIYKIIWWGFGHASQQVNVAIHVSIWYAIAAMTFGARPLSEKVSRGAFLMYILFLQLASAHHLLVEPGVSSEWKIFNTSYAMYLAVVGSMVHGMTIPGAIEAAQRARGFNNGIWEWLRKAPWGNPAFSGMFMSLVMFGFLGGISGVILGTEQLNIIMHNTIYVPGHFHATVVAGTTLTFMAFTYPMLNLIFRKEIMWPKVARLQPYIFGLGVMGISVFMMGAGTLGVARRHWDITFADATFSFEYPPMAIMLMGLNGMSAILAAAGGLMFITVVIGTILKGKPREAQPTAEPTKAAEALTTYGSAGTFHLPGTAILVAIFFLTFILYYFINWKYLATVWPLS